MRAIMHCKLRALVARFRTDDRASMLVEFAMIAPILVTLLMVGVELTRFMIVNQKVERASATMADLVSQTNVMSEAGMTSLFNATGEIFEPFDISDSGSIIVSSIGAQDGPAWINWQRAYGDGTGGSNFGAEGSAANLPDGLSVDEGEFLIACEVFFEYAPMMFQEVVTAHTMYRYAVFRPRFGTLEEILP